ncbi:MAG: O-antigen ligase family protein [Elusimicrobia bacterium]|nr:O-antigen ligase family protein [Elusimicrobiota bacterium]
MFIKVLFSILLFFVPLSFAATEPWAFFVFQIIVSFIFLNILLTNKVFQFTLPALIVNIIFGFTIVVAFIQLLNHHSITQQTNFIPFTVSPYNTLKELNTIFTYMMFFVIVTQLFYRLKEIKKLLYVVLFASSLVMIIGLCFPKGEYIKFFLGPGSFGNFGPFTNRNNAGIFLSMSFFISLSFVFYNFLKYPKYLFYNKNKKNKFVTLQIINITLSLLFAISIIVTRSRGAMFATYITLFIFLSLFVYHFSKTTWQKTYRFLIIFVLLVTSFFAIYKNMNDINDYSKRFGGLSEKERLSLYDMSFDILKDYPLTGIGFASFPLVFDKYFEGKTAAYPEYLHSDWLELLLDIGYPMYIIILLLISTILFIFLRRIKFLPYKKKILFIGVFSSCCSICIGSIIDFHLHIPADAILFLIFLAILCAISFYKGEKQFKFNNSLFFKFVSCLLICCFIFFSYRNTLAWKYYLFSKNMSKYQEMQYLNKAFDLVHNPKYFENSIIVLHNYLIKKKDVTEEEKELLHSMAYEYIKQYPYNNKISKVFLQSNQ